MHANVARVFRIWGDLEIAHGHFQDPEMAQPSGDGWSVLGFWAISRGANLPRAFSGFWNGPARFRILRLPRTFLRLPKGIFTIEALYYWPLIGNHTMGIQRYHFDLLRWPILGVLTPPLFEFCAYLQNCIYYYYSHYFFCIFLSHYCYMLGCIIHKLAEFNAYSVTVLSCVSVYCL